MTVCNQIETEVKYLIDWNEEVKNKLINNHQLELKRRTQFYVNAGEYTIRVSYRNNQFLFTMKLPISGISNYEIETPITEDIAKEFFSNADRIIIKDHGYFFMIPFDTIEINVFEKSKNNIMKGKALLEVEFEYTDERTLEVLDCVIMQNFKEAINVSTDDRYKNSNMAIPLGEINFDELKG